MGRPFDLTIEAVHEALPAPAQQPVPTKLQVALSALEAYLASKSWHEAKRVVEVFQDVLLTDIIDDVFVTLIGEYDDTDSIRMLTQYRKVLSRCRADGVDVAFADLLTERDTCPPGIDLALWRRALLADSYAEIMDLLAEHPELMSYIHHRIARILDREQRLLLYALGALLGAGSWPDVKTIVEAYPALLSLDADIWLSRCAAALTWRKETEAAGIILERRWMLAGCRLVGTTAAFAERLAIRDGVRVAAGTGPQPGWLVSDLTQAA